ncbi:MAG TPA: DoxX family protein [Opitutaceae bacterium]|nr:DoxX family protein [Opitutaceae bacterium]
MHAIPMTHENPQVSTATVSATPAKKSAARYAVATVRLLTGLLFFVFGLNGFLNFIPQPTTPLPPGAVAFASALMATGYMMPLIAVTMLIVGALLLVNRFVPLALVLIAPFIVNSVAFHVFLEPSGRVMAGIVLALELYLAWSYRAAYRPLFVARNSPQ